jgi:hypothetical protein
MVERPQHMRNAHLSQIMHARVIVAARCSGGCTNKQADSTKGYTTSTGPPNSKGLPGSVEGDFSPVRISFNIILCIFEFVDVQFNSIVSCSVGIRDGLKANRVMHPSMRDVVALMVAPTAFQLLV